MRRFLQVLLLLLLCGFAAASLRLWQLGAARLQLTDTVLSVTSQLLAVFLTVLITRYLLLAVFAFLYHIQAPREKAMLTTFPSVSVIIPAYNEGRVIESAMEHALRQRYPNFELIVVDNGSTDDTYEKAMEVADRFPPSAVRVITKSDPGKAGALNLGITHARGELVLCTDADSRIDPDAMMAAVLHFSDPYVSAIAGNVKIANRLNGLTRLQALEYLEGLNLVRAAQAFFHRLPVIPGPFGMFRKEVLNEIGRYADDTFAEDCDLSLRLMLAGYDVKYESAAIVWTEAPENINGLVLQRYRWGRGVLQAIIKNRRFLLSGGPSMSSWFTFWAFLIDGLVLPTMNMVGLACFTFAAINGSLSALLPLWWAQLTMLDGLIAMFCIAAEGEQLSLAFQAVLYRLLFVPFVDTLRMLSWLDEVFNVRMKWMRLERFGRI